MADKPATLPKFSTGLNPVMATFTQRTRAPRAERRPRPEPRWTTAYVAADAIPPRSTMSHFGYRDDELARDEAHVDDTALVEGVRLLTPEGSAAAAQVCASLEPHAKRSSFIISRRLRAADSHSPFLYNMIRDRSLLVRASRIVGVPLIPHPIRKAVAQINYYSAEEQRHNEMGKWHLDGMDYIFSMLLTDPSEFDGSEFHYAITRRELFRHDDLSGIRIATAPLDAVGDAVFAKGSWIYHGVTPLTRGKRTVLTISLFCPAFAARDSNTFMHVAGDDGIPQTMPDWMRLKWPTRSPFHDYALRTASPIVTWDDLRDDVALTAT